MTVSNTSEILSLLFLPLVLFGQTAKTKPNFDIDDFNKKFEVAQWLVAYDTVNGHSVSLYVTIQRRAFNVLMIALKVFANAKP